MSTTNVEPKNDEKIGPVFLNIDFENGRVIGAGEFTTDRFKESGVQEIGTVQTCHNIIDDNGRGFRIIEEGKKKEVEEITPEMTAKLLKQLEEAGKKPDRPVLQSELELIEKITGYKPVIKDKSLIIDDEAER